MASRSTHDLHPAFQVKANTFLDALDAARIPHVISCTLRTMQEQEALYEQGRTTPGRIVTNARPGQSSHNYGLGMDVYPIIHGKLCTNTPEGDSVKDPIWQTFGKIAKNCGMAWGGDFPSPDAPHIEYKNWRVLTGVQHV